HLPQLRRLLRRAKCRRSSPILHGLQFRTTGYSAKSPLSPSILEITFGSCSDPQPFLNRSAPMPHRRFWNSMPLESSFKAGVAQAVVTIGLNVSMGSMSIRRTMSGSEATTDMEHPCHPEILTTFF